MRADRLQINGRSGTEANFDTIIVFQRPRPMGNIGFGFTIAIANAKVAPTVNVPGAEFSTS